MRVLIVAAALVGLFSTGPTNAANGDFLAGVIAGAVGAVVVDEIIENSNSHRIGSGNNAQDQNQRAFNRQIQTWLNSVGFQVGVVDGIVGSRTKDAIRSFQASIGNPRTGILSNEEVIALQRLANQGNLNTSPQSQEAASGITSGNEPWRGVWARNLAECHIGIALPGGAREFARKEPESPDEVCNYSSITQSDDGYYKVSSSCSGEEGRSYDVHRRYKIVTEIPNPWPENNMGSVVDLLTVEENGEKKLYARCPAAEADISFGQNRVPQHNGRRGVGISKKTVTQAPVEMRKSAPIGRKGPEERSRINDFLAGIQTINPLTGQSCGGDCLPHPFLYSQGQLNFYNPGRAFDDVQFWIMVDGRVTFQLDGVYFKGGHSWFGTNIPQDIFGRTILVCMSGKTDQSDDYLSWQTTYRIGNFPGASDPSAQQVAPFVYDISTNRANCPLG